MCKCHQHFGLGDPVGAAFTGLGRFDRACHIPPEIQPATPPPGLFGPDGALPWDRFPGYMPPPDWLFPEPSLPGDVKPPWGMIPPGLPQPMGLGSPDPGDIFLPIMPIPPESRIPGYMPPEEPSIWGLFPSFVVGGRRTGGGRGARNPGSGSGGRSKSSKSRQEDTSGGYYEKVYNEEMGAWGYMWVQGGTPGMAWMDEEGYHQRDVEPGSGMQITAQGTEYVPPEKNTSAYWAEEEKKAKAAVWWGLARDVAIAIGAGIAVGVVAAVGVGAFAYATGARWALQTLAKSWLVRAGGWIARNVLGEFSKEFLKRVAGRGFSKEIARAAVKHGDVYWDPLNKSLAYIYDIGGRQIWIARNIWTRRFITGFWRTFGRIPPNRLIPF